MPDMPHYQWLMLRDLVKRMGAESVIGAIRTIEAELSKETNDAE